RKRGLGRQIEHLPPLGPHKLGAFQAAAAALAALRLMRHNHVRHRDLGEVMTLATRLPARLTPRPPPLRTRRRRLGQPIRRRRLRRIPRALLQSRLQLRNPRLQHGYLTLQSLNRSRPPEQHLPTRLLPLPLNRDRIRPLHDIPLRRRERGPFLLTTYASRPDQLLCWRDLGAGVGGADDPTVGARQP